MKTPEEIKRGLECCTADINDCGSCPFREYNWCEEKLKADALELLGDLFKDREERDDLAEECQKLEQRLAQAERERDDLSLKNLFLETSLKSVVEKYTAAKRERDAAVKEMRMAFGMASVCRSCKYNDVDELVCLDCKCGDLWKWRGIVEENS